MEYSVPVSEVRQFFIALGEADIADSLSETWLASFL